MLLTNAIQEWKISMICFNLVINLMWDFPLYVLPLINKENGFGTLAGQNLGMKSWAEC